jgi:hypothetical protein
MIYISLKCGFKVLILTGFDVSMGLGHKMGLSGEGSGLRY